MGDLFHLAVPRELIAAVFGVMAATPQHTFLTLTKRTARMATWYDWIREEGARSENPAADCADYTVDLLGELPLEALMVASQQPWPLPNVWVGVSAEDQRSLRERGRHLVHTPAVVRWLSIEPLLGPVDLARIVYSTTQELLIDKTHWIVVGGESGPGARPTHPEWVRGIRDQCVATGTAWWWKQWGAWAPEGPLSAPQCAVSQDGQVVPPPATADLSPPGSSSTDGWCRMFRVGKKTAGALLDGREWHQFPSNR